jgi:hypothetical protein
MAVHNESISVLLFLRDYRSLPYHKRCDLFLCALNRQGLHLPHLQLERVRSCAPTLLLQHYSNMTSALCSRLVLARSVLVAAARIRAVFTTSKAHVVYTYIVYRKPAYAISKQCWRDVLTNARCHKDVAGEYTLACV